MKKIIIILLVFLIIISFSSISFSGDSIVNSDFLEDSSSDLPKLYFEGNLNKLKTKKEETTISVKYESDSINFDSYASIKLQGTSSIKYEKKNYTIKFYKDKNLDEKFSVDLGWGAENKYCLKANWIDKTHARNVVTANIVSDIQNKYDLFQDSPNYGEIDGYPVEIYLNEEFLGLYTLNIPKDKWMFNMDEDNSNHLVFSGSNWNDTTRFKKDKGNLQDWEVEVGEESEETLTKLNRVLDFVSNSSNEEFRNNISQYFNLDSLLNYFVMLEFAELLDNTAKNMLLVTYDGTIWYTTLYDLDTSWGTVWNGTALNDYSIRVTSGSSLLWQKLEENFPNEIADRYFELRKTILTEENILNEFNSFINSIPDEVYEKEANRWHNIPGYDIEQIKNFLNYRIPLLDELFTNMYTKNSKFSLVYTRNNDGTITAKLVNVREDISIIGSDNYTFDSDGEHTFLYSDFLDNKSYIVAKAVGVRYNFER